MLEPGDQIPDFELLNQDREPVRFSDFRGRRVVIFTFPRAGTLGCTMQACDMRDSLVEEVDEDVVILGISADSPEDLKRWKERRGLQYDLLSDPEHQVIEMLEGWRVQVLGFTLPLVRNRTLWIVDEQGRVYEKHVPVGPRQSARLARAALNRMPVPARG